MTSQQTTVRKIIAVFEERNSGLYPMVDFDAVDMRSETHPNYQPSFVLLDHFGDVELIDIRVGDKITVGFRETRPFVSILSVERHLRTKSLPKWQPPTACTVCGGDFKSVDGRIVCKTHFETGNH